MSDTIVAATVENGLEDCYRIMEEHQIRRLPVVDGDGRCRGVVPQEDVSQRVPEGRAAEFAGEVSQQTEGAAAL